MKRIALLALLVLLAGSAGAEAPNPFTSSGKGAQAAASSPPATSLVAALAPVLRDLTDRLAELARRIRDERRGAPMLALAAIAFVYGIFHSLGPGHGKTVVSTFFLARDARVGQGLAAGYLIATVHAASVLAIVLSLYYAIRGVFSASFENASRLIQIVSFGAIAAIGGAMLVMRILGKEHCHHLGLGGHHDHEGDKVGGRELLGIAVASGIVPCPGASAILLVSLSLGVVLAGLVAVVMISLGMGITVSFFAIAAILVKRGVLKASESKPGRASRIARRAVEIGGSALLFLIGLAFLAAQF